MRTVILLGCFIAGSGAGAWLGYAAATVFGLAPAGSPRFFPGEDLTVAVLACAGLAGAYALVYRTAGARIEPAGRARAEGRATRNSLLFAATFSGFAVVFAVFVFGRVPSPSLIPAVLVALLLALSAVRRDPLLRPAAICAGFLYVLAGLAVSLARSF